MYRRVQRGSKQEDSFEGPFLIEQEEAPGIFVLQTNDGPVRARTHFLKRASADGSVRSPSPAMRDEPLTPILNQSPSVDDQVAESDSAERRSRRRRNVSQSDFTAQWGTVGEDDKAQDDYVDTDEKGSDLDELLSPKRRGKRVRDSSSRRTKRQRK